MKLPATLLDSLQHVEGFDKDAFVRVHESGGQVTSIRFNPLKAVTHQLPVSEKIPWSSQGYYLSGRPAFIFDPPSNGLALLKAQRANTIVFFTICVSQNP